MAAHHHVERPRAQLAADDYVVDHHPDDRLVGGAAVEGAEEAAHSRDDAEGAPADERVEQV